MIILWRQISRWVERRFGWHLIPTLAIFPSGDRTPLWRELSYQFGDEHADRMCDLLQGYAADHRLPPARGWRE